MALHPIFKLREYATEEVVSLLDSVVLGTNGAHYKHLDTEEKITQADNPLFLSMERNNNVLGNISFCRRGGFWYIRYFAFTTLIQSAGKTKSKSGKHGLLKHELSQFFDDVFQGEYGDSPDSFYAYIDPKNEKSLWMSENFGFETIAQIATQTFSRVNPKLKVPIQKITSWNEVKWFVNKKFGDQEFYFEDQVKQAPYYIWKDDNNEVLGFAKISTAKWEIKRFPGKMGGVLTKLIPFIPRLNRIIRPKNHTFLVPEAVFVKDPTKLGDFFEAILHEENKNLMIWWVDKTESQYVVSKDLTYWGLLDRIIGESSANVVVKRSPQMAKKLIERNSVYTSGFDFI